MEMLEPFFPSIKTHIWLRHRPELYKEILKKVEEYIQPGKPAVTEVIVSPIDLEKMDENFDGLRFSVKCANGQTIEEDFSLQYRQAYSLKPKKAAKAA